MVGGSAAEWHSASDCVAQNRFAILAEPQPPSLSEHLFLTKVNLWYKIKIVKMRGMVLCSLK